MSTENSLILGDELCSGTETTSALKIFAAGVIRLHERNANFIFATHFHEVTHMKEIIGLEHLNMSHMSVIYNREKDQLIYERKLKVGPGRHEYGLEVCKALSLPQDFMDLAHSLNPRPNLLSQHSSHYNAAKLKGGCEVCGDVIGNDIHHLQHQQHASEDGFIKHFHKNHKANLINICKSCHILKFTNQIKNIAYSATCPQATRILTWLKYLDNKENNSYDDAEEDGRHVHLDTYAVREKKFPLDLNYGQKVAKILIH